MYVPVIRDIDLTPARPGGGAAGPSSPPRVQRNGDIIAFYNRLFIPLMKKFVVKVKAAQGKAHEQQATQNAADMLVNAAALARQQ